MLLSGQRSDPAVTHLLPGGTPVTAVVAIGPIVAEAARFAVRGTVYGANYLCLRTLACRG